MILEGPYKTIRETARWLEAVGEKTIHHEVKLPRQALADRLKPFTKGLEKLSEKIDADTRQSIDTAVQDIQWRIDASQGGDFVCVPDSTIDRCCRLCAYVCSIERSADVKIQLQRAVLTVCRATAADTPDDCGRVSNPPDPAVFISAAEIIRRHACAVPSHKALMRVLSEHPEIRRWKPSPKRLRIHIGDWLRFVKSTESDWADDPDGVEERKAQMRRLKMGN